MSNLTCASGGTEASFPSATFYPQQFFSPPPPPQPQPPVTKKMKKRNLPGNPDPESEVIALSPNSLLATNRFICDVCNKGFKRDQNLQLHRRGHNLPWKLKQRNNKDVIRKKVYVCPEVTCVHHDPTRALGDLTGIKKHFCRKHGEKKWKCDKCSKKYAVQSDWKAHSKTCGTREYKCDCGTIFSRRDSFITHRAFCDALAEENVRAISSNPFLFPHLPPPSPPPPPPPPQLPHNHHQTHFINPHYYMKKEQENYSEIPPWLDQDFQNPNPRMGPTHHQQPYHQPIPSPHLSATALLQKASQMGAKMGGSHQGHHVYADSCDQTAGFGLNLSSREGMAAGFVHSPFGNKAEFSSGLSRQESPASAGGGGTGAPHHPHPPPPSSSSLLQDMVDSLSPGNGFEGMTRDFLGLRPLSHTEILNMAGFSNHIHTLNENKNQTQNQNSW